MMGMELMLKNMLGIDPEELKAQAAVLLQQGQAMAEELNQRVARIEMMQEVIARNQQAIMNKLMAVFPETEAQPALEDHSNDSDNKKH